MARAPRIRYEDSQFNALALKRPSTSQKPTTNPGKIATGALIFVFSSMVFDLSLESDSDHSSHCCKMWSAMSYNHRRNTVTLPENTLCRQHEPTLDVRQPACGPPEHTLARCAVDASTTLILAVNGWLMFGKVSATWRQYHRVSSRSSQRCYSNNWTQEDIIQPLFSKGKSDMTITPLYGPGAIFIGYEMSSSVRSSLVPK